MAARAESSEPPRPLLFEQEQIEAAIRDHPRAADEALALIQCGSDAPLGAESIRAFAALSHQTVEAFFHSQIERLGLVTAFGMAMRAAGIPIGVAERDYKDHASPRDYQRFIANASAFRCRIEVNGAVMGSGCLIGPSSVITAWHVIAVAGPADPQEPCPRVEVILADGTRIGAYVPPAIQFPCGDSEYPGGTLPHSNDDLCDRHDVAVLRLKRPVGLHLGAALLPDEPPCFKSRAIFLVHYPLSADQGFGNGPIRKIPKFDRRWAHDIDADAGSSGGGCFDTGFRLVGIHQGKRDNRGRLVPVGEFLDKLREEVSNDLVPKTVWSLNGRIDGQFVLGRDDFFTALATIERGEGGARGIRVKRTDAASDVSGIPFTFELLEQVLARSPQLPFVIRISFDAVVEDLPAELLRRAALVGLAGGGVPAQDEVAPGDTAPEAVEADRGRRAAVLINAAAAEAGRIAWIFIEHPSVVFPEIVRYALEAFIDQAIRLPFIRLVVAGFEAVALPGVEFPTFDAARRSAAPGFLVDYLRGFVRQDVINLLERALGDLGEQVDPGWTEAIAETALAGLQPALGRYSRDDVLTVVERLRASLLIRVPGGGAP